jgi:argininosuccinate lyase
MSKSEARGLLRALKQLRQRTPPLKGYEDVHLLVEDYVTMTAGRDIGGWLNYSKSRNDQVATAIRMVLRDEMLEIAPLLLSLQTALLNIAMKHARTVFPGYTHLQPAQPITFAHYLIAQSDALLRDTYRAMEAVGRINMSPMGAAALAGTSVEIDRALVARLLGFEGLVENTLDAVGSRDFALEALSSMAITASDLARIAQDLIFYSCDHANLLTIPDEFASTSSIMPQKKNPDPLELTRAKCAQIASNFTSVTTILHATPSGYNLDYQEITPILWRSADELKSCLKLLSILIPEIEVCDQLSSRKSLGFTTATEIANILARLESIPFRRTHRAVGLAVRLALARGITLDMLTAHDWKRIIRRPISQTTFKEIQRATHPERVIESYLTTGSPNPAESKRILRNRREETRQLARKVEHASDKTRVKFASIHDTG